ncbi:DNA adenine methylase [Neobacillus soli]|uniref:DNA adenine methylase n=1 Tax=Neobacillus soli TaxID=220688 RepID=UPI000826C9BA|nr:DNA adenine methylase [Neobacillus soli]
MRYIGSKERLLDFIEGFINEKVESVQNPTFADLFCGTAVVSKHFKQRGFNVIANDLLTTCTIWAKAALTDLENIPFERLFDSDEINQNMDYSNLLIADNYDLVLNHLNKITPKKGFIYREYTLEGTRDSAFQRMYFTEENACKIDAIRHQIGIWKDNNFITEDEEALLLASLLNAVNKVANIAGTYGAFLKEWDKRAFNPLNLERMAVECTSSPRLNHEVYQMDVLELAPNIQADVVYLDPPYNFRQYGAYYHILETIAIGDSPFIDGKTGLRPWKDKKSDFCYSDKAASALTQLVNNLDCKHIFLSYNADGVLQHEEILEILSSKGNVDFIDVNFQRYKSNNGGTGVKKVKERLYYVGS